LIGDAVAGPRAQAQAGEADRLAGALADPVGAVAQLGQRAVDLREQPRVALEQLRRHRRRALEAGVIHLVAHLSTLIALLLAPLVDVDEQARAALFELLAQAVDLLGRERRHVRLFRNGRRSLARHLRRCGQPLALVGSHRVAH
jgi:hypothetical protein